MILQFLQFLPSCGIHHLITTCFPISRLNMDFHHCQCKRVSLPKCFVKCMLCKCLATIVHLCILILSTLFFQKRPPSWTQQGILEIWRSGKGVIIFSHQKENFLLPENRFLLKNLKNTFKCKFSVKLSSRNICFLFYFPYKYLNIYFNKANCHYNS